MLASFATGPFQAGSVAGMRDIASLGERFKWVEQRPGTLVNTVVIAREPVGVVVAIAPWNGPFVLMAKKVFYALIAQERYMIRRTLRDSSKPPDEKEES